MPQPTDPSPHEISALLIEERSFPPSAAFTAAAHAARPRRLRPRRRRSGGVLGRVRP